MKKTIQLKDIDPMIFAGTQDKNIKLIEKNFDSKIVLRGNKLYLDGWGPYAITIKYNI